jgi:hypothetical protein
MRPVLALSCLLLCVLVAHDAAAGVVHRNTNGGAACQPRYPGARAFSAGNHSLRNTGAAAQYVVCQFGQMDIGDAAQPPAFLDLHVAAGALAGKVVCVAQMAYFDGSLQASATSTRAAQLAAGGTAVLDWTGADLPRDGVANTLVLDCKLPAGFTLGFIELADPEPAPGSGWVPATP